MFHLFDIIPTKFFSLLSSPSRQTYADILFFVYSKSSESNSYTFLKEDFINLIDDYLQQNLNAEIDNDEDIELKDSKDKANFIFKKLKQCGWIDTEYGKNQQQYVNFEDYAISFLDTYFQFSENRSLELSSYVYRIYHNLERLEIKRGYFTIQDTINQANDLLKKLRSLNSNIKKYIKRITNLENATEEEQLEEILSQLLGEYKEKIIDDAYYYMKTNDNPNKYKIPFNKLCADIKDKNFYKTSIIEQIVREDNVDEITATETFYQSMNYLEGIFDRIISIMEEIDIKNSRYINVAIERIKMLMNHNANVEGYLINILKNFSLLEETDMTFKLFDTRNIIKTSLYTPRTAIIFSELPIESSTNSNITIEKAFYSQLATNLKHSKKEINNQIMKMLSSKKNLTIRDFNIKQKSEFIKVLLALIYSKETTCDYQVLWKDTEELIDNIHIPSFIIERRCEK